MASLGLWGCAAPAPGAGPDVVLDAAPDTTPGSAPATERNIPPPIKARAADIHTSLIGRWGYVIIPGDFPKESHDPLKKLMGYTPTGWSEAIRAKYPDARFFYSDDMEFSACPAAFSGVYNEAGKQGISRTTIPWSMTCDWHGFIPSFGFAYVSFNMTSGPDLTGTKTLNPRVSSLHGCTTQLSMQVGTQVYALSHVPHGLELGFMEIREPENAPSEVPNSTRTNIYAERISSRPLKEVWSLSTQEMNPAVSSVRVGGDAVWLQYEYVLAFCESEAGARVLLSAATSPRVDWWKLLPEPADDRRALGFCGRGYVPAGFAASSRAAIRVMRDFSGNHSYDVVCGEVDAEGAIPVGIRPWLDDQNFDGGPATEALMKIGSRMILSGDPVGFTKTWQYKPTETPYLFHHDGESVESPFAISFVRVTRVAPPAPAARDATQP